MIEIVPAILPKNFEDFEDLDNKLSRLENQVELAQIDICNPKIFEKTGLPHWQNFGLEVDLMFKEAEREVGWLIGLRTIRFIIHPNLSRIEKVKEMLEDLKGVVYFGIALDWQNSLKDLEPFIGLIDTIQVMGIKKIGFQGEPFEESTIDKVMTLRKKYPELAISVDGGVNLENAPQLIKAGATRLVIGSAIFGSGDLKAVIEKFKKLG
ncbi:MAG: hypothetical protein WC673_01555 [Candidatus Paceibacterota bacterium]|jgi:ribulose-phosphate 3-epimerase